MSLMEQNLEERQVWGTLPCRSLMKTSSRPPLVAPLAREGLRYAAGSGGRRQEMFVIRAFPSGKLPSSPDPCGSGGYRMPASGTEAGRAAFLGVPGADKKLHLGIKLTLENQTGLPSLGIRRLNQINKADSFSLRKRKEEANTPPLPSFVNPSFWEQE